MDTSISSLRGAPAQQVVLAPMWRRLAAFVVDLVVVAAALGGAWLTDVALTWILVVAVFVSYHGVLTWLNERTLGKALFGLRLHRTDGRPYRRRPLGLLWSLGRAGLGYLLFDGFFAVGLICALRDPQRRATHDLVFDSEVVLVAADLRTPETRWGLRHKARLERLAREHEKNLEELKPRNPLMRLLFWLISSVGALQILFSWLRRAWRWLVHRLLDTEKRPAAPRPTPGRTRVSIAAGTAAVSVAAWLALVPVIERLDDPPPTDGPRRSDQTAPAGGASSTTALLPAPVTLDEIAAVSFPFANGIESLPEDCAAFWEAFGDPAEDGFAPEDNGITLMPDRPVSASNPNPGEAVEVGDVDGDTANDGVAAFRCTNGGNAPPSGLLVLRASDRSVTMVFARDQIYDALQQALGDQRHHFLGPVGVVSSGADGAGQIYVQLLGFQPDDPSCCPTMQAQARFRFVDSALQFVALSEFTPL